jgi:hypothetical protein
LGFDPAEAAALNAEAQCIIAEHLSIKDRPSTTLTGNNMEGT